MNTKALIVIDYQKEWINESSDYFVGDIQAEIQNTKELIHYCRENDYKIIFTKHVEPDSDDAFKKGSPKTELIDEIGAKETDIIITKDRVSPFFRTNLDKELAGIDDLVVVGILTNLCVRSTIHDAYDRDMDITVIKDCCVAFDQETQDYTFKDLKATREEIEFVNLEDFINGQK